MKVNDIKYLFIIPIICGIIIGISQGCKNTTTIPVEKIVYVPVKDTISERTNIARIIELEHELNLVRDSLNMVKDSLGEDLFIDEETGEVSTNNPNQVEIGESDVTIEMPNDTEDISGNITDVEIDENNTTIEMSNDTEDISANITDVEIDENNTTIEMPNDTEDISGNMTDVKINENNTTDNGTINIKDEKNKN